MRALLAAALYLAPIAGCVEIADADAIVILVRSEFAIAGVGIAPRAEVAALACDRAEVHAASRTIALDDAGRGMPDIVAIADRGHAWRPYVEDGAALASTWTSMAGAGSRFGLTERGSSGRFGLPDLFEEAPADGVGIRWSDDGSVTVEDRPLETGERVVLDLDHAVLGPDTVLAVRETRTIENLGEWTVALREPRCLS